MNASILIELKEY